MNKIFYVCYEFYFLLAVYFNLYFDSHHHSLKFEYTIHRGLMHNA